MAKVLCLPHYTSTPYRPQSNGEIEREIGVISQGTKVALYQSGADHSFWLYASRYFCLAKNITKLGGVSAWILWHDGVDFDFSQVAGIGEDLVVRPFGRTGCCATVREFDQGALQFHHGIQPAEIVGVGVDADGELGATRAGRLARRDRGPRSRDGVRQLLAWVQRGGA